MQTKVAKSLIAFFHQINLDDMIRSIRLILLKNQSIMILNTIRRLSVCLSNILKMIFRTLSKLRRNLNENCSKNRNEQIQSNETDRVQKETALILNREIVRNDKRKSERKIKKKRSNELKSLQNSEFERKN